MANQFLTVAEVAQGFLDDIKKACKGDAKLERAIWYELQTRLGRFPDTPEERKKAGIE